MAIANLIDPEELKKELDGQYIVHGFSKLTKDDEEVVDENKMKLHVYDIIKKKVARARQDIAKNSVTNGELYALTFPNAPGTDAKTLPHLTDMEREVRKALQRKVWGLTQPKRIGFVQKKLGAEATGFVLCRTQSTRNLDDVEVCFVTDNADLIMDESVLPQIEALITKANDLRLHTEMVTNRRPELKGRVKQELGAGVKRIDAALPHGDDSANGSVPAKLTA